MRNVYILVGKYKWTRQIGYIIVNVKMRDSVTSYIDAQNVMKDLCKVHIIFKYVILMLNSMTRKSTLITVRPALTIKKSTFYKFPNTFTAYSELFYVNRFNQLIFVMEKCCCFFAARFKLFNNI